MLLPDPPDNLPDAPRAFYSALREALLNLRPADVREVEVDFGDSGVGVTIPHRREPDWTLGAQVSKRAAVVFAGSVATEHFDDRDPGWTGAAAAFVAAVLRGELEGIDFGEPA